MRIPPTEDIKFNPETMLGVLIVGICSAGMFLAIGLVLMWLSHR